MHQLTVKGYCLCFTATLTLSSIFSLSAASRTCIPAPQILFLIPPTHSAHEDQWSQGQRVRGSRAKEERRVVFYLFCGAAPFDLILSRFIHPENLLCVSENWGSGSHLILGCNEELPVILKG